MTALFALIIFFFIFVLAYSAIAVVVAVVSWWLLLRAAGENAAEKRRDIERRMDRIKDKAFIIALILTFFIVAPFVVLSVFVVPG